MDIEVISVKFRCALWREPEAKPSEQVRVYAALRESAVEPTPRRFRLNVSQVRLDEVVEDFSNDLSSNSLRRTFKPEWMSQSYWENLCRPAVEDEWGYYS